MADVQWSVYFHELTLLYFVTMKILMIVLWPCLFKVRFFVLFCGVFFSMLMPSVWCDVLEPVLWICPGLPVILRRGWTGEPPRVCSWNLFCGKVFFLNSVNGRKSNDSSFLGWRHFFPCQQIKTFQFLCELFKGQFFFKHWTIQHWNQRLSVIFPRMFGVLFWFTTGVVCFFFIEHCLI